MKKNIEKNKMTDEEMDNVTGGRNASGHGHALGDGIAFYFLGCEKSPDYKHFYDPVRATNLIWKFNIVECKCRYCGKISHELGCDPIYH